MSGGNGTSTTAGQSLSSLTRTDFIKLAVDAYIEESRQYWDQAPAMDGLRLDIKFNEIGLPRKIVSTPLSECYLSFNTQGVELKP